MSTTTVTATLGSRRWAFEVGEAGAIVPAPEHRAVDVLDTVEPFFGLVGPIDIAYPLVLTWTPGTTDPWAVAYTLRAALLLAWPEAVVTIDPPMPVPDLPDGAIA